MLISQIEHARAAGRLAEHWGGPGFAPLWPRSELLWAIFHHDDGWAGWDESPGVEPASEKPRSFTEMEIRDSLAIWSGSIAEARRAGPFEAFLVTGHFCALARRAMEWKRNDADFQQADRFVAEYENLMVDCLRIWQSDNPANHLPNRAATALAQLQFFDFLSLWFCCAAASEPDQVQTPSGPLLTLTPGAAQVVALSPWPLRIASLRLEVQGRLVPARRYATRSELAAVPAKSAQLTWHLQPG